MFSALVPIAHVRRDNIATNAIAIAVAFPEFPISACRAFQHLDELSVSVGVLFQLDADLGEGRRQIPVLERGTVAQGAGFFISTGR